MVTQRNAIAIIDDDAGVRQALSQYLSVLGYSVESYGSAEAFLQAASTSKAACLLVDIHLGDITGIEMIRQLLTDGFDVPFIFMSGAADNATRRQALQLDCVAYLQKPIPSGHLLAAIADALQPKR